MKNIALTQKEIAHDIKRGFRNIKEMTKKQYKITYVVTVICGIACGLLELYYLHTILWVLLGILVLTVALVLGTWIRLCIKKSGFCIDDYEITTDVLEHKTEEHYIEKDHRRHGYRRRQVDLYDFHFACGKTYRVPAKNYTWSVEWQSAGAYVYENAHRGDKFIVVIHKKTGEIAVVYPMRMFVYKGETV